MKRESVAAAPGNGPGRDRLFYLDNLKVVLISLVVVAHAAITYGPTSAWYYNERWTAGAAGNLFLTLIFSWGQAFIISAFIVISGYFVPGALARKGPLHMLLDRFVRLGIPALLYHYFINPSVVYFEHIFINGADVGYLAFIRDSLAHSRYQGVGPLWYAVLLLVLTYIFLACRSLGGIIRRWRGRDRESERGRGSGEEFFGGRAVLIFAIILAAATYLIRLRSPAMDFSLSVHLSYLIKYIAFFIIGIKAHDRGYRRVPPAISRTWLRIAAATVLAWPFMIVLGWDLAHMDSYFGEMLGMLTPFFAGPNWQTLAYAAWESFFTVGICITLLTWFQDRFNSQGALLRAMSASAFTIYILHGPVVVLLSYALRGASLLAVVKFFIVAALGIAVSFALGHFVVRRIPVVNKVL